MQHSNFKDLFAPYLDGLLPLEEKKLFEQHINECPECKNELEDTQLVMKILSSLPDEEVPFDIASLVKKEIQTKENKSFISKINLRYLGIAAVFLLMITLTVLGSPTDLLYAPKSDTKNNALVKPEQQQGAGEEGGKFGIAQFDKAQGADQAQKQAADNLNKNAESAPAQEGTDTEVKAKSAPAPAENSMMRAAEAPPEEKAAEEAPVQEKDVKQTKMFYFLGAGLTTLLTILALFKIKKKKIRKNFTVGR